MDLHNILDHYLKGSSKALKIFLLMTTTTSTHIKSLFYVKMKPLKDVVTDSTLMFVQKNEYQKIF